MITERTRSHESWGEHLHAMEVAIAGNNASATVLAWRTAYATALEQPGWRGLVDVADAALRIGTIPGFRRAAESRARESYWTALFRARRQGSLNGVLEIAEAFAGLGDGAMVEQCLRIAERLAALSADTAAAERVRTVAGELAQRQLVADHGPTRGALAAHR
jgi:hypothetical protein